jgi:ankyrin repeat protein
MLLLLMGHLPATRLLLQYHPAFSDIRDNHGRNFLHAAAIRGHHSIISYVIKKQNAGISFERARPGREYNITFSFAGRGIQSGF